MINELLWRRHLNGFVSTPFLFVDFPIPHQLRGPLHDEGGQDSTEYRFDFLVHRQFLSSGAKGSHP